MLLNAIDTTNKQIMSRRWHIARVAITSLQLVIPNWFVCSQPNNCGAVPTGLETGSGGTASVTASIEYPAGTFTQVKFSGGTSGSVASGTSLTSDSTSVSIPANAVFYVRVFWTNPTAIAFGNSQSNNYEDTPNGDAVNFSASGLTDQTMGGTVTNADATRVIFWSVSAIIATTTAPAVCLLGDSRTFGYLDLPDASGDMGNLARAIGPSFSYINMGSSGDRAMWVSASGANRVALSAFCSHIITEYGINDAIAASRTALQIETDLGTIWSAFPGKPIFHNTYEPWSTSTDSWATVGNQTTIAGNAARVTVNTFTRGTPAPLAGFFEIANVVESSLNSGLWKAPSFTADGIHKTNAEYVAVGSSGAVNTSLIHRP
jgi:hypothetical protein